MIFIIYAQKAKRARNPQKLGKHAANRTTERHHSVAYV